MHHTLPKARFFGPHFCRKQYRSNVNHRGVIGCCRIRWNNAK